MRISVSLALTCWTVVAAQTQITLPFNSYGSDEEVQLGRDAATELRALLPIVGDADVNAYVQALGRRLVGALPQGISPTAFRYSFEVINAPDVAAVGLPGGPVFVGRTIVESARSERELAAFMARALSHVALRHGTAQVTAGKRFELNAFSARDIVAAASGTGPRSPRARSHVRDHVYFFTFSLEYERQADVVAAAMLAAAGLTSPDLVGPAASPAFASMQARLRDLPPAPGATPGALRSGRNDAEIAGIAVPRPSGEYRQEAVGGGLRASVPGNWSRVQAGNALLFAPEGAFLRTSAGFGLATHGLLLAVTRSVAGDLQADLEVLLRAVGRRHAQLRWRPAYQQTRIGRLQALTTAASHVSATGQFERVLVAGAYLPDRSFLYAIGVAPEQDASTYQIAFSRSLESIEILGGTKN